jgi:hypothetical protein
MEKVKLKSRDNGVFSFAGDGEAMEVRFSRERVCCAGEEQGLLQTQAMK